MYHIYTILKKRIVERTLVLFISFFTIQVNGLGTKDYPIMKPHAEKILHVNQVNGESWVDQYDWLRDKGWPKVTNAKILNYLKIENDYADAFMAQHKREFDVLYNETIARIKLEDSSVPIKKGDYYYYTRTEKDSEHPIYCRKKSSEEVILDLNLLSKGNPYFDLDAIAVNPDHTKLLYAIDLTGEERYTIRIKDLTTQQILADAVQNSLGPVFWNKDSTGFFYTKVGEHWRTEEVYFHRLGTAQTQDRLVYKEDNTLFKVGLSRSSDERFIFIVSASKDTTEIRYLDLHEEKAEPVLIQKRVADHRYMVDHHNDRFYILTNCQGKNFSLMITPVNRPEQTHWSEFLPYNEEIYLDDFSLYKDKLVLSTKEAGLTHIKIIDLATKTQEVVKFPEPTYHASQAFTTFDATGVRIHYSSLVSPDTVFEYNFDQKKLIRLKEQEIPSGYNKTLYHTDRIFATGQDGTKIPISLVYKKSLLTKDGKNPLYLYSYGSYGAAVPVTFKRHMLSFLDRGFVYAIAHVRGGDEMGHYWYETGKFLNKKNTFHDFISAAQHLIDEHYTSVGNITITGRSAGGMLVGVCLNEKPELYKVAVADVPFVDVLNTMLDDTLPLTPGEFKEWGNPKDPTYFQYIKSYSPYDNVKAQAYPALYVTAGINDPRVTYWEAAKWVAKLRENKTDKNLLLFNTHMDAGHAGISGRFGQIAEMVKENLFILLSYGISIH